MSPDAGSPRLTIRAGTESDLPDILRFIKLLAEYERLSHQVVTSEDILREELFGPRPSAEVLLAYTGDTLTGFAIYFHNFSTFIGRKGLYLEDLFVLPEYRGKGIGKALLIRLARIAVDRNCGRFEWAVLDWNEPAIEFYKALGAEPQNDWTVYRLSGSSLADLASMSSP